MKTKARSAIAGILIIAVTSTGLPKAAWAGSVSTERALTQDHERIRRVLDRSDLQAALGARGVTATAAKARVAALSDAEAGELAARLDSAPAGGDVGAVFVLPILAVFFVIWLLAMLATGGRAR